jgi:hypothetical protein
MACQILARCGSGAISWEKTEEFGKTLRECRWREGFAFTGTDKDRGKFAVDIITELNGFRYIFRKGPEHGEAKECFLQAYRASSPTERWYSYLERLVQGIRNIELETTDPRDWIYALVGLVERYRPPELQSSIYSNYNLSVEELYTFVSAMLLTNVLFMSLLSTVEDRSRRKLVGLPSWVVDSSQTIGRRPLVWLGEATAKIFNASYGMDSPTWSLTCEFPILIYPFVEVAMARSRRHLLQRYAVVPTSLFKLDNRIRGYY